MDPVVVGTVGARPLQGREPEMALLASLIDGVGSKGASLVLRGEPGIGKSRLLREAITLAEDRNMTVVSTSGVQAEARLPFAGLHQLLRPVRDRAMNLMPEQRLPLDAAFGLDVGEEPARWPSLVMILLATAMRRHARPTLGQRRSRAPQARATPCLRGWRATVIW
jgi:AAA ATPase domain